MWVPPAPSCQEQGARDTPASASREEQSWSLAQREGTSCLTPGPTVLFPVGQTSMALSPVARYQGREGGR